MANDTGNKGYTQKSSELSSFYSKSSVHVPNKFDVVLYGPYVQQAIIYLQKTASANRSSYETTQAGVHRPIDIQSFTRWKQNHVITVHDELYGYSDDNESENGVRFKWACSGVSIPVINPTVLSSSVTIEPFKNLKHQVVSDYSSSIDVRMSIVEERGMMWYQFLNALTNLFFHPELLTPRASILKMHAKILPLSNNTKDTFDISYISDATTINARHPQIMEYQLFEFNSVVLTGIGPITFSQNASDPLTYEDVMFKCSNPFQKSMKTELAHMADNISDSTMYDSRGDDFGWDTSRFELR